MQAQDNLLQAKVQQAFYANKYYQPEVKDNIGDKVILTTLHRCHKYKRKDHLGVAKSMPCQDGPYTAVDTHPQTSSYTLDLPNSPNIFPVFHSSELSLASSNDASSFLSCSIPEPFPVITSKGYKEQVIDSFIDEQCRGHVIQYLLCWKKFGPEHDKWLPRHQLLNNTVLDDWEALEVDFKS